jgi:hypothetical protein
MDHIEKGTYKLPYDLTPSLASPQWVPPPPPLSLSVAPPSLFFSSMI